MEPARPPWPRCARLAGLRVRGFKSLRSLALDLPTRLTVLVGPNGSGKTAVLEALLLLRDILDAVRGRVANPFTRWWGYSNAVWMHREEENIGLGFRLDLGSCSAGDLARHLESLGITVDAGRAAMLLKAVGTLEYRVEVTGAGGGFQLLRDRVEARGLGALEASGAGTRAVLSEDALATILLDHAAAVITDACGAAVKGVVNEAETLVRALAARLAGVERAGPPPPRGSLLGLYDEAMARRWASLAELAKNLGLPPVPGAIQASIQGRVAGLERLLAQRCGPQAAHRVAEQLPAALEAAASEALSALVAAALLAASFIDGIVVLRLPDYAALRAPQPPGVAERLSEDASNLQQVLYRLGRGRLPEDVARVLEYVLQADEVTGFFEPTPDGRLVLVLDVDGVRYLPPMLPEGAWKAMALMAALLSSPSLVAVDEFEDSLHAQAQELLLEELRAEAPAAIVATHSVTVMDSVESLEEIVVLEKRGAETVAARPETTRELLELMQRLGLTPGEAVLYKLAPGEQGA